MRYLLILLAFIGQASAGDPWDKNDKAMFAASTALLAADWAQTRYIAKNPERFHETNPLLGKHPSLVRVNNYFAWAMVANYFITNTLSPKYRRGWQMAVIGVEGVVVARNYHLGIGMTF